MDSSFFQIYSKVIRWCDQRWDSKNRLTRWTIKLVGAILYFSSAVISRVKGFQFPARKLGARFWIGQWRLEFLMGWMEGETIPWVKKYVKPGMTVVDIGAHVGYYTDLFARLSLPGGTVHAFEASPENYPILLHNLKTRKRNNVIPYPLAVNDQNGTLDLYISPGHSNHSIIAERTEKAETVSIQSVRLDDFLKVEKIDFVKMDVEGAEPHVLNGMRALIQASENLVMVVEYNYVVLSKAYSSPQVLLDLLTELEFTYKAILENGDLGEIPTDTKTLNLLCWKSGTALP